MNLNTCLYRFFIMSTLLLASSIGSHAAVDKKHFEKVAKEIWSSDMPQFNPEADLSDSLFQNRSGVYIARYTGLEARYDNDMNSAKISVTGISNNNAIKAKYLQRTMVKLLDQKAVEHFGEFSIQPKTKEAHSGFVLHSHNQVFGARIFKADGSVVYSNPDDIHTKKKGKKEKDSEYLIALPGLEVGDVLDFFYLDELYADEISLKGLSVSLLKSLPTLHYQLECKIAPELAFEYGIHNGAPNFQNLGKTHDGLNHVAITIDHMDAIEEKIPYFAEARQMPYITMHVLNNQARLEFQSNRPRLGGIRKMIYPFLTQDAALFITATKLPEKLESTAISITKDWIKAHPEATDREKSDAAWMAVRYAAYINNETVSNSKCCVAFCNVTEKLKFTNPGRIALVTSRDKVPVNELASCRDAEFSVVCGDAQYFPGPDFYLTPGEIPAKYGGERCIIYNGSPYLTNLHTFAQEMNVGVSKAKDNKTQRSITLKVNPENPENLLVQMEKTATGVNKSQSLLLKSYDDWCDEAERYLGVKNKRKKGKETQESIETRREQAKLLATIDWGSDDISLTDYAITAQGTTPDANEWKATFNGEAPSCITQAGNGLMVKLGQFTGTNPEYEGSERKRDIAVVFNYAKHTITRIQFEVPEGYQVQPESLESLNRNIIMPEGSFFVKAMLEDNKVKIDVSNRINQDIFPAESWDNLLQLLDAAHEFCNASIVLKPV